MRIVHVSIIFPATLGSNQIESQLVSLGGIYPDVNIESLDDEEGLHLFKIEKNLPHASEDMLKSATAEAEREIEVFWNVLAYLLRAVIRPRPDVQYEVNGVRHDVRKQSAMSFGTARAIVSMGSSWFLNNADNFHHNYSYNLLKRYNFARSLEDPVSRFLSLYSLLSLVAGEKQRSIDSLIESEEPTVAKTISPNDGKMESTFTRLRNELAHRRDGVAVFDTHEEIRTHVARFEWIVDRILAPRIGSLP